MGKTKIKTIDDAVQTEPPKKAGRRDELVEKLKAELGAEDQLSVLGDQLSDKGQPVISKSVTEKQTTGKLKSENRQLKTDHKKVAKSKPRSKKYQEAAKDLDRSKAYPLNEAVEMVKKLTFSKFTGTLEAHINTVQTGLRGLVSLPHASGKTEYKTEAKAPVIHLGLGKLDQPTEELSANIKQLLQTIGKTKVTKVSLSPTMGPSVKVDLASI